MNAADRAAFNAARTPPPSVPDWHPDHPDRQAARAARDARHRAARDPGLAPRVAHYPITARRAVSARLCRCEDPESHPHGYALAGPAAPTRIGVRATDAAMVDRDAAAREAELHLAHSHAAAGWAAYVYDTSARRGDVAAWLANAAQAHAWPEPVADLALDAFRAYVAAGTTAGPIHLWHACEAPTGPGTGLPVVGSPWGPVTCHVCLSSRLLAIGREATDRETGLSRTYRVTS